ncbi:MAG: PsbP-related protein [Candidatus Saccharimonadales bacterium]
MSVFKPKSRSVLPALVVILIGGVLITLAIHGQKTKPNNYVSANAPASNNSKHTNNPSSNTSTTKKYVTTSDFKYLVPDGWTNVEADTLKQTEALSGIRVVSVPITFLVSYVSGNDVPKTLSDYKQKIRNETINRYSNLKILNEGSLKIDGQEAYQYTYRLGYDNLTEQQFILFLYQNKAFALTFTGPEANFKSQTTAYNLIISSFQLL